MGKKQFEYVPQLRFEEFGGEWQKYRIDTFLERYSDPVQVEEDINYREIGVRSHGKGIFHKELTNFKKLGNKRVFWVHPNAFIVNIVFAWEQAIALTSDNEDGLIASHRFPMYIPKDDLVDLKYLLYFFLKPYGKYLLELASPGGAGRNKTLGQNNFNELKIHLPSKQEQQKIASFLTSIDIKIEQLTKKEELFKQYKKGVMQKIFSQEIRFKADDGSEFLEWEEKRLKDVFTRITAKNHENNQNVLTISAQYGLINQKKFFNKSVSAKDVTGYYLLEKGDFAYNKSYSNGYPMGAIKKLNNYDKGVVSTLYICFRINSDYNEFFYEKYFDSGFLNRHLHKIAQEGARNHGLLNISVVEFFNDIKIPVPSNEEQTKIANFLSSIDSKIELVQTQLEATKKFKKGLLQQMFV